MRYLFLLFFSILSISTYGQSCIPDPCGNPPSLNIPCPQEPTCFINYSSVPDIPVCRKCQFKWEIIPSFIEGCTKNYPHIGKCLFCYDWLTSLEEPDPQINLQNDNIFLVDGGCAVDVSVSTPIIDVDIKIGCS